VAAGHLAITWWGHASSTVEIGTTKVAIDPLLTPRLLHLRRYAAHPPRSAWEADLVLVSHLHSDHFHVPSLRGFPSDIPIVVPRGGEGLLSKLGADRVQPADPGDVLDLAGVTVRVLPATHEGRRGPHSRLTGPALGFRVDGAGRSFWFPGDTELRADMAEVGGVDLALVPIGGWGPTLEDGHMDPVDGAKAVRMVDAATAIPVHWGTFWPIGLRHVARANHDRLFTTPGQRFLEALEGQDVTAMVVEHGCRVTIDDPGSPGWGDLRP
jgi:L-ascorbate metabolism protein UlaG (beta-lactamase superfamily)